MAAVDLVLRRSTRIAQHPHHTTRRRPLNKPEIIEEADGENDELTPRALRALKRQRLALDSDGLLLPHIETHHRRKRRKENDNTNVGHGNGGEPRHIPPLAPTIVDLPEESLRNVLTDQLAPKESTTEPKPTTALDLDSLIPLDPLPEFPPPYTDFQSFTPSADLSPFPSPFGSSQPGSHPFPPNPTSLFSHEFIPQPEFTQANALAFPNQEYTNGYNQSNGYPQQATFSQLDYTPAPHRDREVNIWKLACQERVEFLLRRYGIDTIKALVASEARARFPSPSNTRFRLYTPASYIERASYTYRSAEAVDFDVDDEEDEDEDLDECDLGGDYDDDYDDDEEDAEGEDALFLMDVDGTKGIATPCVPAIVTPTVPTVPSILPTPHKQPTSLPRSTSPPALVGRSLLDTMPTPRPLCASPPCSPPRRTPSPPQRLSAPSTLTPTQTPPSTPASPSTPTPPPSHPTPTPQTPPPIHSIQTPPLTPPQLLQPTPLPRTPPLSSLHVTLLSEPPRAFMGRGTPPDRRRLSEWGRWGCVQVYGKGGERRRLSVGHVGDHMHLQPIQCGEMGMGMGMEQLRKEDITRHENPPPLQLTEHQHPQQHEDPHPNPHEDPPHTHTHTHTVPGEWTSFLFAMLEGDGTGSSGWYELGAQGAQGNDGGMGGDGVPQSMNMGILGGAQGMVGSLGGAQSLGMGGGMGLGAGGQGMVPMAQTVSIGEADSTLRFALG
ncbi:hypothetical protein BDR05DRAFT_1001917 [Suillus weaverae]|nr:hypothetical protein BDR05DRAFT_1001917 [Suillus weaverae]